MADITDGSPAFYEWLTANMLRRNTVAVARANDFSVTITLSSCRLASEAQRFFTPTDATPPAGEQE